MRMLRTAILVAALAVVASPSFDPQEADPLSAKPRQGGNPLGLVLHAAVPDLPQSSTQALGSCSVTATCADGSTRTCSDRTSPFSCQGQDQDCDVGIQGYVQCNGGWKSFCPISACDEECTEPLCSTLNGQSCSPNRSTRPCRIDLDCIDNGCMCEDGKWLCVL